MEWCTTALSSSTQHRVCAPVFYSEVHRDGLDGWPMLSLLRLRPRIVDRKRGSVQNISREKSGFNLVTAMPTFKINAAVGDSSSPLPVRTALRVNKQQKINPQEKILEIAILYLIFVDYVLAFVRVVVYPLAVLMEDKSDLDSGKELMVNNLKRYGVAGILSYGLLNTVYYLGTFLFVWFYVAPSPGGLGFVPAAQRFLKVFATVWAGSQVTKLLRAAGALSLAPLVDRGLNWYTQRFNFKSRATAFSFLVGACFGLATLVFLVITTLWS